MPVTVDPPESLQVVSSLEGFTARLDGLEDAPASDAMRLLFWTVVSIAAAGGLFVTMAASEGTVDLLVAPPILLANLGLWATWYASRSVTTVVEVDAHRLVIKSSEFDASVPLESVLGAQVREYVPRLPWLVVHTADRSYEILVRGHSVPDAQWLANRIAALAQEARARPALSRETVEQAESLRKRGGKRDHTFS